MMNCTCKPERQSPALKCEHCGLDIPDKEITAEELEEIIDSESGQTDWDDGPKSVAAAILKKYRVSKR